MPTDLAELATQAPPELVLAIDHALDVLESEDAQAARIVRLRFFGDLTSAEVAVLLNVAERTVMRRWAYARARLYQILGAQA